MKVAIIINSSWNIYNFRSGLVKNFISKGHSVVAIAPKDEYTRKLEYMGCDYVQLDMEGTGMNPFKDLLLLLSLSKILKSVRPDVVLSYTIKPNLYASIVAGRLGIPCICNVSGLGTVFLWKGIVRKLAIQLYRFAFRSNKWIFFQNEDDREDFVKLVGRFAEKSSLLPGSGVDTSQITFQPFETKEKTIFLMVSRLIVEKGVREYAEAARIISGQRKDVEFRLVGALDEHHKRSVDQSELDHWIEAGYLHYKPHQEDVIGEMQECEVVVLPSYREGTPRTLLEAGALGKALIATDVPGCRQVVDHGENGFLCDLKNPQNLAEKMLTYLSLSENQKLKMSLVSRKKIEEQYDEKHVIHLYEQKIQELTQS
ncbi:glycosyltransferase family 4 protein [Marinoscillum sp. MHG1-6]|uniref:glycosyltransferase family 4 protein n=1 Tax=Marinoscillum sp. MHG1-6 TaxID=2959627 RepID=UPI002157AD62|nr:glycosyltransferase family 4 protein [Marinoscillum sp. MHG1-6]